MSVTLTKDMLTIKPHWFAIWMIIAFGLDLNHEIPVVRIKGVTHTGNWFGYGIIEVDFSTDSDEKRTILLYLKKDSEFIEAVNTMIAA